MRREQELALRSRRLVLDGFGYSIPPNLDDPVLKAIAGIIYLPLDANLRKYGTSLMIPKNESLYDPVGEYDWRSGKIFES